MRKETGININDDIIVYYEFNESEQATQLINVCENMKEQIIKVLKVPFNSSKPDQPYQLHAEAEYEIGGDNKEKEKKKGKDESEKEEVIVPSVEVKSENLNVNKNTGNKDAAKKNPIDTAGNSKPGNQDKKQNDKKEKKVEKKKEEVKIEKEEKLESAGKISIMIFKK